MIIAYYAGTSPTIPTINFCSVFIFDGIVRRDVPYYGFYLERLRQIPNWQSRKKRNPPRPNIFVTVRYIITYVPR